MLKENRNILWLFERDTSLSVEQRIVLQAGLGDGARFAHQSCALAEVLVTVAEWVDTLVIPVGSVEFVRAVAEAQGFTATLAHTWPGTYPARLYKYLRRSAWSQTWDEARAFASTHPVFVKPVRLEDIKRFTGTVIGGGRQMPPEMDTIPGDMRVWCAVPVHFVSEFRVYIIHGETVGIARYDQGESDQVPEPDRATIASMINDHLAASAGYGLDVGVLDTGETVLVEANDGWALGYYPGVSPGDYKALLAARWQEIAAYVPPTSHCSCPQTARFSGFR